MRLRLLVDGAADGAVNMAVDETLLDSAMEPDALATLRLYRFRSPTVTFGYSQAVSDAVDPAACERLGVDYVRRITGGRALLHQHELTYSFAAPARTHSVKSVYRTVTGAIRSALERLEIPLDPPEWCQESPISRGAPQLPCLAVTTGHEITAANGCKLVPSALRFRRRAYLQHGSILGSVDPGLWKQLSPPGRNDALRAVGIRDLSAAEPPLEDDLIEALASSFAELAGVSPVVATSLSPEEVDWARKLERKYRSQSWTRQASNERMSLG